MTIRDTLQSAYPDYQFMGTRRLGSKYTLCRGMNQNRLTGTVVCTWDADGNLYANSSGLSPYEKRLVRMVLMIWRGAHPSSGTYGKHTLSTCTTGGA